jgi:hypothetical protein
VAEKSPSHNPFYICICMCNLCDLATFWNPQLVHGNPVSAAQTCRVELQRITGLNLKLYCVTLTVRHCIESTWHTGYCQILPWTRHRAERFFSPSEFTICHSTRQLWVKNIMHFTVNVECNPPHVILWAALKETHFTDPHLFTGPVNFASYPEMLNCAINTRA